eukprot:SAG31_NODE_26034_length_449_cov_15.174286_1_plen_27_part_01
MSVSVSHAGQVAMAIRSRPKVLKKMPG